MRYAHLSSNDTSGTIGYFLTSTNKSYVDIFNYVVTIRDTGNVTYALQIYNGDTNLVYQSDASQAASGVVEFKHIFKPPLRVPSLSLNSALVQVVSTGFTAPLFEFNTAYN